MTVGYVYAIDGGDAVKIGWSGDPQRRFSKVSSDNPAATRIIGFVSATTDQEKALHDLFAPWRIRREWYRNEGPVAAFVEMLPPLVKRGHGNNRFIGEHALSEFRSRKGLSKAAIAARVGTSRQTIHRIETGEQTPSMALVRRLVDATEGELRADDFMPPTHKDAQ